MISELNFEKNKDEILEKVNKLVNMYKKGLLGGEVMP